MAYPSRYGTFPVYFARIRSYIPRSLQARCLSFSFASARGNGRDVQVIRNSVGWIGNVSRRQSYVFLFSALMIGLLWPATAMAQNPARPLVTQAVDESKTVMLHGTVHPLAQARFDQGAVSDSFAAKRMLLMLNRSPEREAALRQFLTDVHTQGSPSYHQWITPEQFGESFGPADSDIQAATSWLASHGFQIARVSVGKGLIEFSGTAANVREAFHTQIHQYSVNGETHFANASEISVPEALAPLIRGITPIGNFRAKPALRSVGPASYSRATGKATPLFTISSGDTAIYALAPEDFATQYDLGPLYTAGTNGTGQTIGIIGESNLDITLVNAYRSLFGLSGNPVQIIIDGNDPGIDPLPGSDIEAYLDVELSGAVAPDATVNLYISDGSDVQDPITLAAVRSVTDNDASVLSLSISECEVELTSGGNLFWSGLWEQATAQGQTVFVATGDSGSAGCDFDGEPAATQGLAVNGVGSTPWNVAVGGTDFLYPAPLSFSSPAPFWNATNDAKNGSLIAPLPEQPWDTAFGKNINGDTGVVLAGGGGPSTCGPGGFNVCGPGYPKPIWQAAPGVPNDGVRDIPDVSLFASANANLSDYPICAEEVDCAGGPGGANTILLVGGTSASSPAMAGIMALVDQKYGRQGQADFTLYALARQQPAVFHDITVGTNNVPCAQGSPNCSLDGDGDGLFSLQEYPAGAGYDLASGLGSVDGNLLVTDWNKVSFTAATTTLSLAPTTFVHGALVTVNASVAPASGSSVPTGNVVLVASTPFPMQRNAAFPLVAGAADGTFDFFPGGTYQVTAQYSGDGVFGPSTSTPVTLTVTPEPSNILFIIYGPNGDVVNGPAQAGYGGRWILSALPFGLNGDEANGLATGSVTFTDGANTHVEPLNSIGNAAYSPGLADLPVGSNPIMLSYAGDASYQASTAGPFIITITKGDPGLFIPFVEPSVPENGSLTVDVVLGSGFGTPPTGSVSVSLGANVVVAPLVPTDNYAGFPHAVATATLTNFPATGSFPLTVSYPGDSNWTPSNQSYATPISVVASALKASTTTFSASPSSITRFQSTNFTATVQSAAGTPPVPTGSVVFYVNGQALPGELFPNGAGGATATPSGPVPALVLSSGSNPVVAVYSGDGVYNPSTSAVGNVTVDLSTFSISLQESRILITSGQTANTTLVLVGQGGFNGPLALSCEPSSNSIGCFPTSTMPMVSGTTTATLTVNAFLQQGTLAGAPPVNGSRRVPPGVLIVSALLLFLALLRAPRSISPRLRWALGSFALALLLLTSGCGGGAAPAPPPPPPPQKIAAPPGEYSVVVTAAAGGTIRNIKLIVIVQPAP